MHEQLRSVRTLVIQLIMGDGELQLYRYNRYQFIFTAQPDGFRLRCPKIFWITCEIVLLI